MVLRAVYGMELVGRQYPFFIINVSPVTSAEDSVIEYLLTSDIFEMIALSKGNSADVILPATSKAIGPGQCPHVYSNVSSPEVAFNQVFRSSCLSMSVALMEDYVFREYLIGNEA